MVTVVNSIACAYRKEYDRNPVLTLFLTILIVFFIIFAVAAVLSGGDTIYQILFWDRKDTFMDHFNSIMHSLNPYPSKEGAVIYPPLIMIYYAILGHFTLPFVEPDPILEISFVLRYSQMGMMTFIGVTLLTFYMLHVVFSKLLKEEGVRKELLFLFLVLLAYPFIHALERGNSIILALVFCCLFLLGYRSENKYVRYASYIALGCAAGIKMYPAILGLLILRERRYKEMALCILAVAALVFVPFIVTGGNPLILFGKSFSYADSNFGLTSIPQIVSAVYHDILGLSQNTASLIGYVLLGIFTLLSFIVIIFDKEMKHWKVVALVACNLILGFGIGSQHQIIYMLPAMLLFLNSEKDMTRENLFYIVCFTMMMVLIPGVYIRGLSNVLAAFVHPSWLLVAIESIFVVAVAVALLKEGIVRLYRKQFGAPERAKGLEESFSEP